MKCSFELPVFKPQHSDCLGNYYICDAKRKIIVRGLTSDEADYLIIAINSHEKLVNACEKAKWLYDELALSSLGAACKYGDDYEPPTKEDCLEIRELLEQALKSEKP